MTPALALQHCREQGRSPFVIVTIKDGSPIAHVPRSADSGLSLIKAARRLRVEDA